MISHSTINEKGDLYTISYQNFLVMDTSMVFNTKEDTNIDMIEPNICMASSFRHSRK